MACAMSHRCDMAHDWLVWDGLILWSRYNEMNERTAPYNHRSHQPVLSLGVALWLCVGTPVQWNVRLHMQEGIRSEEKDHRCTRGSRPRHYVSANTATRKQACVSAPTENNRQWTLQKVPCNFNTLDANDVTCAKKKRVWINFANC